MNIVNDAMQASMPASAGKFIASANAKPMGEMIMYLGILGILPIVGYLLGGLIGGVATFGLVWGIVMAVGLVGAAMGAGFIVSLLSQSLAGRQITPEEGITICGYAMTPVFVASFIAGLLVALWQVALLGTLLLFLATLYMTYLVYVTAVSKYGADKAIGVAIVALVGAAVVMGIFWAIANAVTWSMIWGYAVGPRYVPQAYYYM